jgi:hypothetical protein
VKEFDGTEVVFDVVLRVPASAMLAEIVPARLATVHEKPMPPRTNRRDESRFLAYSEARAFLLFTNIKALDARVASNIALGQLEKVNQMLLYHAHRGEIQPDSSYLVHDGQNAIVLEKSPLAIHKYKECPESDLPVAFRGTINNAWARLDNDSRRRFTAALGLHTSAVASKDPTVQLIALWAAMESMLLGDSDQSNIAAVSESLAPALCRYYLLHLLRQLQTDLERCIPNEYDRAAQGLPQSLAPHLRSCYYTHFIERQRHCQGAS